MEGKALKSGKSEHEEVRIHTESEGSSEGDSDPVGKLVSGVRDMLLHTDLPIERVTSKLGKSTRGHKHGKAKLKPSCPFGALRDSSESETEADSLSSGHMETWMPS